MANKRIKDLTEKNVLASGDYFPIDNSTDGTKKVNSSKILDPISHVQEEVSGSGDSYSSSKSYAKGDLVIHDNVLYVCTSACTAGSWATNSSHFTATTLASEVTSVKQTLQNGNVYPHYKLRNAYLNVYWAGDTSVAQDVDWTTQNATDVVQGIYDLFKDCEGLAGVVYTGKIEYASKKASDGSTMNTNNGYFELYSNNTYNQMIQDNSQARLTLEYHVYGSTLTIRYGLWGNILVRSVDGMNSSGTVYNKNQRISYSTISTYKG